ncbi:MAG: hypothetical protein GTN36_01710 [Candidatus Aenigmarchaeota archaeon]|nr:hypothetical protein [Candidatus Aenigmarchaeota archaeon]
MTEDKTVRKKVKEIVKIPSATYESLKHVKSDGANADYTLETEEKEFAGC